MHFFVIPAFQGKGRIQVLAYPLLNRLLYFRASVLVRLGIKLVFVLDGRVPDLKQGTVGQRIGNSGQVRVRSRLNALASQVCIYCVLCIVDSFASEQFKP